MLNQPMTFSKVSHVCLNHSAFEGALPWLTPLLTSTGDWPTVGDMNGVVKNIAIPFPWEFVVQEKVSRRAKSRGMGSLSTYLDLVISQGKIPVRERNIHDLLNALSFIMFPMSKAALNRRHYQESPNGLKAGQNRTRTQDHLTIFDEGGVIRLKYSDPKTDQRLLERDFIFGHAIYEHIINGKVLRAARLDLTAQSASRESVVDQAKHGLSSDLTALLTSPLSSQATLEATNQADKALAECLLNEQSFLSSTEFGHLWINP